MFYVERPDLPTEHGWSRSLLRFSSSHQTGTIDRSHSSTLTISLSRIGRLNSMRSWLNRGANSYFMWVQLNVFRYSFNATHNRSTQSTVLLAVDISYLAVPDITTAGRIASLCSVLFSVGCVVVGLLLINKDHADSKTGENVSDTQTLHGYVLIIILLC